MKNRLVRKDCYRFKAFNQEEHKVHEEQWFRLEDSRNLKFNFGGLPSQNHPTSLIPI